MHFQLGRSTGHHLLIKQMQPKFVSVRAAGRLRDFAPMPTNHGSSGLSSQDAAVNVLILQICIAYLPLVTMPHLARLV